VLNKEAFVSWYGRLSLSREAQTVIAQIRCAESARRVGGGRQNVSGRYPSRKMGLTIQFESHRVELAFVYQMEHDEDVLEYYDQPPSIQLKYEAANGRRLSVWHTPDFFVIRRSSAGWEECKTESELKKLAEKSPHRYQQEGGGWRCRPGEEHAAQFGLYYRFRSSAEINWTFQQNVQFLEDYWRFEACPVAPAIRERVRADVALRPGLCLSDLFARTKATASRDDIYRLIAVGDLHVNFQAAALVEPDRVRVFSNRETATACTAIEAHVGTAGPPPLVHLAAGSSVTWDSRVWKIVNMGERRVSLLGEDGAFTEIPLETIEGLVREDRIAAVERNVSSAEPQALRFLSAASEDDLKVANRRYELIQRRLHGERPGGEALVPERTLRLWMACYKQAKEQYGSGYVGLIPKTGQRGNRGDKLSAERQALLDEFIANDYETLKQKSRFAAWAGLVRRADQKGVRSPSYVTFCRAVARRPKFDQSLNRQGPRAAYRHELFYWELTRTTPRHGDRPFEIGHLDHTQLDVEVVSSHTNRVLGRPWMTFLTDTFSRRILAFYLTFDEPSYRSCMMLLRECVRRHARLPQITILDGGPEFKSTYFETLVARYQCTKKTRPCAKGRFGSVIERLFGTTNTQFIHNLRGNTQITRNVRQVTKSVNPREQAIWTLAELHKRLSEYLFEVYDTMDHPALGQSPRDAFRVGLETFGFRPECRIPYNQDFIIATLPAVPKGTAKLISGRGVKVNHIYYWSSSFQDPAVENQPVPVRYDPFDVGTAYAYIGQRWVECHSEYYAVFHGRSEKELMLASSEIRRRQQCHSRGLAVTAKKLGTFLHSVEADEVLLIQRLRDREAQATRNTPAAVNAAPHCPEQPGQDTVPDNGISVEPDPSVTDAEIYGEF
jgi:transposase InsO family protein